MASINKNKKPWLQKTLYESFSETTWEDMVGYGGNMLILNCFVFWIAIYFSFKCNDGFEPGDFFAALCCAPCYIIYVLTTNFEKCTSF